MKGYNAGKEVFANIPFGKVPKDIPQIVIPKKTTTDLYPASDAADLQLMKERLRQSAQGTENITLSEITASPYKAQKEVEHTVTKFDFLLDDKLKDLPIGTKYKKIETLNDGNYTIYKSTQSGSNPGFWVEHEGSGNLFYFKTGNGQQNITEHVSSQLYRAAGIDTPEINLVAAPGFNNMVSSDNCWIKSKAVTGLKPISKNPKAAYEGFAVDAWLANWDAVCSGNTLLKNGNAVRVDFGGTLNFRARGARKTFGNEVPELSTLLDPKINPESAKVFKNMTREYLINSLERVQSVTNDEIQNIYNTVNTYINPEIFTTIKNRKSYLGFMLQQAKLTKMSSEQTILDYVKTLETKVSKKYNNQIAQMNTTSAQRTRVKNDMIIQRDAVCSTDDLKAIWNYKGSSFTANTCINQGRVNDHLVKSLDEALSKTHLTEPMTLYRGDHLILDMKTNMRYRSDLPNGELTKDIYIEYKYDAQGNVIGQELRHENGIFMTEVINGKNVVRKVSMQDIVNKIFKKGKVVEEQQFVSTSVNPEVAQQFAKGESDIIYRYKAPKGLNATCPEKISSDVIDDAYAGAKLTGNGGLEGSEAEILLKRGFKYRMDDLKFEDGHYIIECTILP